MARPGDDPARRPSGTVAAMSSKETDGGTDVAETGGIPRWLAVVAAVVLVVGLVLLVVFGVRYSQARSAQEIANQRDTVSDVASQVIINAFSFDYRNVDESLEQLESSSTGAFLDEQAQWSEDVRKRVLEQKAVTNATVSNTAVEKLDLDAGEAAVLIVFTAHSEREGEEDITGRQAMRVDLTRVDDQWKANAVNQVGVTVPVGQSSQSVQDLKDPAQGADAKDSEKTDGAEKDSSDKGSSDKDDSGKNDTAGEESTTAPAPTTSAGR